MSIVLNWLSENWFWTLVFPALLSFAVSLFVGRSLFSRRVDNKIAVAIRSKPTVAEMNENLRRLSTRATLPMPPEMTTPELTVNGHAFLTAATPIALEAMALLDQRSKRCAAYLLTAVAYLEKDARPPGESSHILVDRKDLRAWRDDWLAQNAVYEEDGVDIVTPFDLYLYS